MLVVRLSSTAERINVMNAILHNSFFFVRVFRVSLTKLKPPFWSTSSTMVIAPIRKNSVVAVLPKCRSITSATARAFPLSTMPGIYCDGSIINKVQHNTNISRAIAALLIFVTLSMAIKK